MTEEQFKEAERLNYDIGLLRNRVEEINKTIKSLRENETNNCELGINLLGGYQIAEFDLCPLTKKIVEVLVEHLTERKERYNAKIKELREKFKKI